jgi:ATP-dependent Clp protease ATP-binding subunit ClpB
MFCFDADVWLTVAIVQVKKELDDLRDKLQPLTMKYRKEKERIDEIRKLKQRREELQFSLQEAERRMDLARVADLKYGALQEIDAAISKLESETGENLMLTETVGPEQIAEVCPCSCSPLQKFPEQCRIADRLLVV